MSVHFCSPLMQIRSLLTVVLVPHGRRLVRSGLIALGPGACPHYCKGYLLLSRWFWFYSHLNHPVG